MFEIGGSKDALTLLEEALSLVMSSVVVGTKLVSRLVFRLHEVSIQLVVTRLVVGTRILGLFRSGGNTIGAVQIEVVTSLASISKMFSTLMLGTAKGVSFVSGSSKGLSLLIKSSQVFFSLGSFPSSSTLASG